MPSPAVGNVNGECSGVANHCSLVLHYELCKATFNTARSLVRSGLFQKIRDYEFSGGGRPCTSVGSRSITLGPTPACKQMNWANEDVCTYSIDPASGARLRSFKRYVCDIITWCLSTVRHSIPGRAYVKQV